MLKKFIIRCKKCGKVLKGKTDKDQIVGRCPHCNDKINIPGSSAEENRKNERFVVSESKFFQTVPDSFAQSKDPPACRIIYTECPAVEFAIKRSKYFPLLDLSESGMGILMRTEEVSGWITPENDFAAEIDFPVLDQPIIVQVRVCWIRPIKEDKLLHVGVQFLNYDESFIGIVRNLINYIKSRTDTLDFDKWGAFG